ncbi:Utp14 family protein [Acanthocheilonema viteae]
MNTTSEDSDFDEEAHTRLLNTINNLGNNAKKGPLIRKCPKKVQVKELVDLIRSTKNVDDVKKKLIKRKKKQGKAAEKDEPKTLQAPSHRLLRERIESSIAYSDIRKDLEEWAPIVKKNRLAEQLVFPLTESPPVHRIASDLVLFFKPRTPMEIELAKLLKTSNNNLRDGEEYTEAELELIRAMSLKKAKAKWIQLKKMRALVGYREAKLKRQAKIKSKSYHRHMKRQKRKQMIKEFEEMMMKNPEAAKEKLEEIDRQRILERATLKHRNGGKGIQQLSRYANKNKDFKKIYEEQIRLGRELVEKHGREKDSDSNSEAENTSAIKLNTVKMLENAAETLEKEEHQKSSIKPELKAKLHEMRERERETLRKSALRATDTNFISHRKHELSTDAVDESRVCNEKAVEMEWSPKEAISSEEQSNKVQHQRGISENSGQDDAEKKTDEHSKKDYKKLKKKSSKKMKNKKESKDVKDVDIDQLFDKAEKELTEYALKKCELLKLEEKNKCSRNLLPSDTEPTVIPRQKEKEIAAKTEEEVTDISLDPRHFLQIETMALPQVSADFVEILEEQAENQEEIIAKAFEDVDVIGDFEADKETVEAAENPKDTDLTLQGWGSWTGPGIIDRKKNRFVIKAPKKKRKDAGKTGLIISEAVDPSIEKFQLKSVPFPYTTVEDYEAVVRQPLGKEWNPQRVHMKLIQPQIIVKAGKIIKPLDKSVLEDESDEEK